MTAENKLQKSSLKIQLIYYAREIITNKWYYNNINLFTNTCEYTEDVKKLSSKSRTSI